VLTLKNNDDIKVAITNRQRVNNESKLIEYTYPNGTNVDNFLSKITAGSHRNSTDVIIQRRQIRDLNQDRFVQAHKDNKRMDNPFLTLHQKELLAAEKAEQENLIKKEKALAKEAAESAKKQKEKQDVVDWYNQIK